MMIDKFAEMIKECNSIIFFGGAGVSTESGVKDYRSTDGLYNTVKEYGVPPEEMYKSMELKDKLPTMTEKEQLKLLATDGMLVKRPLVIGEDFVLVGFKESEWSGKL